MAIHFENETKYEGKVVSTYSKGTYNDDYYYAVVWSIDENGNSVFSDVMYDTTAHAGGGSAIIDAPESIINEYVEMEKQKEEERQRQIYKNDVHRGNMVKVVRGRKLPIGTVGEVFWIGANMWDNGKTSNVGLVLSNGEKVFTAKRNVERV